MATNIEIIAGSLRLLGVIAETETPSAEQGSTALTRLNQMIESWTENGVELGYFEQSSTTATCPIPRWTERGVVSKLAQDLLALYPTQTLAPWVWDDGQNGYGLIARRAMLDRMEPADMSRMPLGEGHRSGYRILTDD